MKNKEIIKIIKNDIKELKGIKYKIVEGLNINGCEVCLMAEITGTDYNFFKSVRTIKFKSARARDIFLKELKRSLKNEL